MRLQFQMAEAIQSDAIIGDDAKGKVTLKWSDKVSSEKKFEDSYFVRNCFSTCDEERERAILNLYKCFKPCLDCKASRLGLPLVEREQLAAEILLKCYDEKMKSQPVLKTYHGQTPLRSYLITSLINNGKDVKRRERRVPMAYIDDFKRTFESPTINPEKQAEILEMLNMLLESWEKLSAEEQVLLILSYFYDTPQKKIGIMYNRHQSQIKRKLEKAKEKLMDYSGDVFELVQVKKKSSWQKIIEFLYCYQH